MNYRHAFRAVLIGAIYFALYTAIHLLTKDSPAGTAMGLRQTPGLMLSLLVLCGPGYAVVTFAAQLFFALAVHQRPGPPLGVQVALTVLMALVYALAAWLVRRKLGPAPLPVNRRQAVVLALAALVVPVPSAFASTIFMPLAAAMGPGAFFHLALLRWMGGVGSILTIVPAVAIYVAPWVLPDRRRSRRRLGAGEKAEIAAQGAALLAALWLVYLSASQGAGYAFFLCFVLQAWIGLRRGLAGTTLATLIVNVGSYVILRLTGAPGPLISSLPLFELSYAAVGLGLGAAVNFRDCAEAALAESQASLQRVLAGARLGMWDCDLVAGHVTYDDAWAEMAGYRLEEIPDAPGWWEDRLHPADRERVQGLLADHLAGRTPFYEAEFRFRMRDGGWKWIHARGSVTERDAAGKPLRHAGTQIDLTDRKQAEADKNRLLQIIEASCDFIGSVDLETRVIYANPALLRLRGLPDLAAARGLRFTDFYPAWAAKKVRDEGRPAALERGSWMGETALLDTQGREIPVSQFILAQRDDLGQPACFSVIARDISKQRQVESARLESERTMLQAQKLESLGVLAGGIAHDFNNLLTVMLGNVSLAQLDVPAGSPIAGNLQEIRGAVARATELCRQMLAYSGKSQFSAALVDLSALVADTTQLLQVSISKKCALKFELQQGLPSVRADASQIRQIVLNLVVNASDAAGGRSGLIRVSTGLMRADAAYLAGTYLAPDLAPGDYAFLEVADDGGGMTAEVKARAFEPFFTTKFAGRGLGLAAVLGIVRGHRGAIKVESEPGRGATFRVLLAAGASAAEAAPGAPPAAEAAERARGAILVVDDEETVRMVAARLLESQGYTTVEAADGREAVRIFGERPADFRAVLLDLTMPHMNGEETFRELRRIRSDVPVLLMSGFSEKDSANRFAGRDRVAFVSKPFERETLLARLRGVLEAR